MDIEKRFELYQSLYFRELERIEKISARLALPFGVLLTVAALLSFMLNSASKPVGDLWCLLFWALFILASVTLAVGAWFFRMAWFGHTDKLLPTATDIENYHSALVSTYEDYEGCDELVEKEFRAFLFSYYRQFASENAINNDRRSYNIYRALVAFTCSIFLALLAAIPFYIGTLEFEDPGNDETNTATATSATTSA